MRRTVQGSPLNPGIDVIQMATSAHLSQAASGQQVAAKGTSKLKILRKVSHVGMKSKRCCDWGGSLGVFIVTVAPCNTRRRVRRVFKAFSRSLSPIKQTPGSPLKSGASSSSSSTQQWLQLLPARCLVSRRRGKCVALL